MTPATHFQLRQEGHQHINVLFVDEGVEHLLLTASDRALPLLQRAVDTANRFAEMENRPILSVLVESHEMLEVFENGWDVVSTEYTKFAQEETEQSPRRLIARMASALEPFAENPNLSHMNDAACHNGITTRENCGRCGRGIKAYEALQAAQEYLNRLNGPTTPSPKI